MQTDEIIFQKGFSEHYRSSVAALYDEAFGQKFSVAVSSDEKRLSILEECLMPEYAIAAIFDDKAVKNEQFPYLRWLLAFSGSTTMELSIEY